MVKKYARGRLGEIWCRWFHKDHHGPWSVWIPRELTETPEVRIRKQVRWRVCFRCEEFEVEWRYVNEKKAA